MCFDIFYISLYKIGGISALKRASLLCIALDLHYLSLYLILCFSVIMLHYSFKNGVSSASKIIRRKYKTNF